MLLFAAGCTKSDETADDGEIFAGESYVLKANVISVSDRLEVEVIESDYAFGVYWVLINENTKFEGVGGNTASLSDVQPGDTIEITYGGQVMMSYPPQIVAWRVTLL